MCTWEEEGGRKRKKEEGKREEVEGESTCVTQVGYTGALPVYITHNTNSVYSTIHTESHTVFFHVRRQPGARIALAFPLVLSFAQRGRRRFLRHRPSRGVVTASPTTTSRRRIAAAPPRGRPTRGGRHRGHRCGERAA